MTCYLATYLMFTHYTADLTSEMTTGPPEVIIDSFEDVLREDFDVVTKESHLISITPEGTPKRLYYETRMKGKDVFFNANNEAIKYIMERANTFWYMLGIIAANDERIVALEMTDAAAVTYGLGFTKEAEYTDLFNFQILKLLQSGIVNRISKGWFPKYDPDDEMTSSPLGYDNLVFPIIVYWFGVLFAVVISLCEKLSKFSTPKKKF